MISGSKVTWTTSAWPVRPLQTCSSVGFGTCPPAYPEITRSTPRSSLYTASRHQKQPPPSVAVSSLVSSWVAIQFVCSMAEAEPGGDGGEAGLSQSSAYVVEGGSPLHGSIPISGAKNAVLKLMAAAVLCDEPCTITNAPRIADVQTILEVLCDLGAEARWVGDHELRIHARELDWDFIPLEAAKRLRASFVLLGPMLGRRGKIVIPNPGGDRIGRRPVNVHVDALRALGAEIVYKWGYYFAQAPGGLRGTDIRLAEASVTGTENVLMSAVLAEGRTTITNAAAEPEVDNLIDFLNAMGGRVKRDPRNAHTIVVEGVPQEALHGAAVEGIPDRIEAGSFAVAAAITRGEVFLAGARADHLGTFLDACRATGIEIEIAADGFHVTGQPPFRRHEITTQIYPGFPTDLQAPFSLVLVNADGVSTINELLYEDRF